MRQRKRWSWIDTRPVAAAVILGLFWGVFTGLLFGLFVHTNLLAAIVIFTIAGVLGFGPLMIYFMRHQTPPS